MLDLVLIVGFILVCIALWKYHIPGTILWGSVGLIFYILSVYNEMSKGISFNRAWQSPSVYFPDVLVLLIGMLGLISLLIGIYIELKKRKKL